MGTKFTYFFMLGGVEEFTSLFNSYLLRPLLSSYPWREKCKYGAVEENVLLLWQGVLLFCFWNGLLKLFLTLSDICIWFLQNSFNFMLSYLL